MHDPFVTIRSLDSLRTLYAYASGRARLRDDRLHMCLVMYILKSAQEQHGE